MGEVLYSISEIARITGGVYFNADSLHRLQEVYGEIDQLERSEFDTPEQKIVEELFPRYALAAFLAYALYLVLAHSIFDRLP